MEPLLNWWQLGLLALAFGVLLVSIYSVAIWKREMPWSRGRRKDDGFRVVPPGETVLSTLADGLPDGPRGHVWTGAERQLYRNKKRNTHLRLVGRSCPPHKPEYDESVNETYCANCMERLPNQ